VENTNSCVGRERRRVMAIREVDQDRGIFAGVGVGAVDENESGVEKVSRVKELK